MNKIVIYSILFTTAALALSGCGIKPGNVDPPPGAEKTVYPQTYPDPATDPAPEPPPSGPVQF